MGERLNIEIKENGVVLANAYYHWSGFTSSAIRLTQTILDNIDKVGYENKIINAIKLLETTGSGLMDEEFQFGKRYIQDFTKYDFKKAIDRNEGLTAISEKGIGETEHWEEHRVKINIDTKTIDFGAVWKYTKEEYKEDYSDEEYKDMPIHNIYFSNIKFSDFKKFGDLTLKLIKEEVYEVKLETDDCVYGFVE